jgi:hypothetical protein
MNNALVFMEQVLAAQQSFLKSLREAMAPALERMKVPTEESGEPEQPSEVS